MEVGDARVEDAAEDDTRMKRGMSNGASAVPACRRDTACAMQSPTPYSAPDVTDLVRIGAASSAASIAPPAFQNASGASGSKKPRGSGGFDGASRRPHGLGRQRFCCCGARSGRQAAAG